MTPPAPKGGETFALWGDQELLDHYRNLKASFEEDDAYDGGRTQALYTGVDEQVSLAAAIAASYEVGDEVVSTPDDAIDTAGAEDDPPDRAPNASGDRPASAVTPASPEVAGTTALRRAAAGPVEPEVQSTNPTTVAPRHRPASGARP